MGAEAVYLLVKEIDLNELGNKLAEENPL